VIGEHDGRTGVPARAHLLHHLGLRCGVQAGERLIEDQQRRVAEQGLHHGHLLAHAFGQLRERCVGDRDSTEAFQEFTAARRHKTTRHAPNPTQVTQVLAGGERQARRETLGHIPDLRRQPGDPSAGGRGDAGQDPQQCALPASVVALHVDQRTRRHTHLNVVQHQRATSGVPLTDPMQPYLHGVPSRRPWMSERCTTAVFQRRSTPLSS